MFRKLFAVDALFTSRLWRAIQLRFNEKVACLSGESRVSVNFGWRNVDFGHKFNCVTNDFPFNVE